MNILLFSMILLSAFTFVSSGADESQTKIVFEENDVRCSYDSSTKTLTLSGTGAYSTACGDNISSSWGGLKFESFSSLNGYREITEKIVVEEGITVIGGGSFAYFKNLKAVELPNTLTEIQPYAFYECYRLESIELPQSLEKIGFEAFRSCRRLTELNIPENVKEIADNFIFDTVRLAKITVDSKNEYFTAENNVLYNKNKTKLLAVAPKQTTVKIPSTVTEIADLAFALSKVKEIVIPKTVTDFGRGTFYKSAVEKITFRDGIKISAINSFDRNYGDDTAECYGAFENCVNLKRLVIPNSVKNLGFRPFGGCSSLEYLYIGKNVKSLDGESFYKCKSLAKIKVNKNNKYFYTKKGALYSKSKLRKKTVIELVFVPVTVKTFKVPDNVYSIGEFAFANGQVENITVSKSVVSINNGAFYNCKNLKSISFEKGSKLTTLGYDSDGSSYNNCCYAKPTLENYAMFYNCKKLKSVTFPDSLESTRTSAPLFKKCKRLKTVHFGKKFGDGEWMEDFNFNQAVVNCTSFEKFTLSKNNKNYTTSDGVVYSKDKTKIYFYPKNKTNKTFVIPKGVTKIDAGVFKNHKYLKRIKFVYNPKKSTSFGFGSGAFGEKTVLVKKNSNAHKALKNYRKNFACKVNLKFYK